MLYEGVSARPTTIPLAKVRESVSGQPMSAAGQSRHFGRRPTTSGLPLETDIVRVGRHVSKVPMGGIALAFLTTRRAPLRQTGCSPSFEDSCVFNGRKSFSLFE
jgi:hypothetical protein